MQYTLLSLKFSLFIFIIIHELTCVYGLTGCGHSSNSVRIVGGQPAKRLSWPWMAYILIRLVKDREILMRSCGGSIISNRYILTAAHCFDEDDGEKFSKASILLGKHHISHYENTEVIRSSIKIIVHEKYNSTSMVNDIALIKLNKSLNFKGEHKHLQPICLPKVNYPIIKKDCVATGWGDTSFNGTDSETLRQVRLPILNDTYCQKSMELEDSMKKSMFCAGYQEGGKDTCQGDSGGPLVCPLITGTWIQYGVTSFGNECARKGQPGVYTRVSYYYDWITKHSNN